MVYKVTFAGIDGCGKSSTVDAVSRTLSGNGHTTLHSYRPSFVDIPGRGREYLAARVDPIVNFCHEAADDLGWRELVGFINTAYGRLWSILERIAIKSYDPEVVLSGRDPILDSTVYSQFYFPFTQGYSNASRFDLASSINGARMADMVLYMDIDPNVAFARIQERIKREKHEGPEVKAAKWTHMHETPENLEFLRGRFESAIPYLVEEKGLPVVRIDASRPKAEVIEQSLGLITDLIE